MRQISIVIPKLYATTKTSAAWQKLIKSSHSFKVSSSYSLLIAELLKINPLPLAALSAAYAQLSSAGRWLKATPISLTTDQNSAYIVDASLAVAKQEIQLLVSDLNQLFSQDGLIFHAGDSELLLEFSKNLEIITSPLTDILHSNIAEYLPQGADKAYWHKLFIEIQMFLYQHPINKTREQKFQTPISALWFWGEGELPISAPTIPWSILYGDCQWLKDYASFATVEYHPLTTLAPLPTHLLTTKANSLIIMEQLLGENTVHSSPLVEQLMALLQKLKKQPKLEINLYPGDGNCYHLTQRDSWWQRFKNLLK